METTTRVNYDELNIISKKIHDEGEDYAQLISSTRQKMAALRSEWIGEAADEFFEEMENGLLPAVHRLSQGLLFSQEVLNKIMKTVYEADQETGSFFNDVDAGSGMPDMSSMPGVSGLSGVPVMSGVGSSDSTDHFHVTGKQVEVFKTPESETTSTTKTPPAAVPAAGGGGGGGGVSGQGLQGDLSGMGSGLGAQPASNASVGGSTGGAESLPDHNFGGGGSSGGGSSGGGSSGPASQGGGGASGGSSGGGASTSPGGEGIAAGIAGVGGSAAVGGAAKVLKGKQDDKG